MPHIAKPRAIAVAISVFPLPPFPLTSAIVFGIDPRAFCSESLNFRGGVLSAIRMTLACICGFIDCDWIGCHFLVVVRLVNGIFYLLH